MNKLSGEIGKLSLDGEQVGGFKYWTVIIYKKPPIRTEVIASRFWMFKKVNTNKLEASFFADVYKDALKLIYKKIITVNLPDEYPLDTMISIPLKMVFEDGFDWLCPTQNK